MLFKNKLTKEQLYDFCLYYRRYGDSTIAAKKVGIFENPELSGLRLLSDKKTVKTLKKLESAVDIKSLVRCGLERIALGDSCDCAKLVTDELSTCEGLDLYMISEIKKPKGGGIELKLFSRIDALEKLLELDSVSAKTSTAESFFNALSDGAKALSLAEEEE